MKTIKIGLSCSPSKMISTEKIETKKVLISYGGGMGGAHQKLYATNIKPDWEFDGHLRLTLISGEEVSINPAFIVMKNDCNVVKVVTDNTQHANYNEKSCNKSVDTEFIELRYDEDYVVVNEYTARHMDDLEGRVILKTTEKK